MTNGEVEVGAEMTNDGWNEKVESLLINNFSCDANERKKKWKRSEGVCDREEEGECTATMLQCGVDLLAAALKRRLLASLTGTAEKCWPSGRVHRNW